MMSVLRRGCRTCATFADTNAMQKCDEIQAFLEALRRDGVVFSVVDHWDGDLCAIGVANPADVARLFYVSWRPSTNDFFVEIERPPPTAGELPYSVADSLDGVSLQAAVGAAKSYLPRRA